MSARAEWRGQAQIFRLPDVVRLVGVSRATVWRWVANNLFPAPVRLGPRAVGWRRSDLDAWLASRPQQGTEQAIAPNALGKNVEPIRRLRTS